MTPKQPLPTQPDPPKKRRSAKEQALAPLIKRYDALKQRWDEADAAALRKNKERFGPECAEIENIIAVINGQEEPGDE